MITKLLISSILGSLVIIGAELARIKKLISNETSRKVIHVVHGLVVASWIFIASYNFIIAAEVLFLAVVSLARWFNVMQPLRSVNRKSWGDLFFPLSVIIMAAFGINQWVFLAAMLHLALADALAALVGRRFHRGVYYVFGQRKSVAGSAAFYITSLLILLWLCGFSNNGHIVLFPLGLFIVPLAVTLVENLSPYGSDNLTIPLVVTALLAVAVV